MWSCHTIGDEIPSPLTFVFQAMFLAAASWVASAQLVGGLPDCARPEPNGPRQDGQLESVLFANACFCVLP